MYNKILTFQILSSGDQVKFSTSIGVSLSLSKTLGGILRVYEGRNVNTGTPNNELISQAFKRFEELCKVDTANGSVTFSEKLGEDTMSLELLVI